MKELRVLLIAENASERMGGEAIIPLQYFRFLKKRGVFVKLLTHERVKEELSETLKSSFEDVHFVRDTFAQETIHFLGRHLTRRSKTISTGFLIDMSSGIRQRKIARELVKKFRINVVHQPIPVSPKLPSFIFDVGAPVIIGPMNGGMKFPSAFRSLEPLAERILYAIGKILAPAVNCLIPGKRKASLLLIANERTRKALPGKIETPIGFLTENGVDLTQWNTHGHERRELSARPIFVYVGALIGLKGVQFLLQAVKQVLKTTDIDLEIIGDGPEAPHLRELARQLSIEDHVRFLGFKPHSECPELVARSRALVLPSLYECGGAVVLEALALGVPVVATKWGGPAEYLNEKSGILVEPTSQEAFVDGLSKAILSLAQDRALAERLGRNGKSEVIKSYDWVTKVQVIMDHYARVERAVRAGR